jgi:hypothetical protein
MNADRPHESAELELPLCHCPNPFWLSLRTKIGTAGRAAIAVRREDYFVLCGQTMKLLFVITAA